MAMKLRYFDGRGVAETTRLLFKASKTAFIDERYDMATMKEKKEAGEFVVSMGKLPILEVDGVQIAQSKTIERFVAKHVGMLGSSPIEEALIDSVCEHKRDVRDAYQPVNKMEDGDEKTAKLKEFFHGELPKLLGAVETALPAAPGPWLVTNKMTLADVAWFQLLIEFWDVPIEVEGVAAALASVPRMKAAMDAVLANPEIAAWRESRPKGMF